MKGKIIGAVVLIVGMVVWSISPASGLSLASSSGKGDCEYTGWVTEQPEGEGWVLIKQRTVVDKEAYDEVVQEAVPGQHYSHAHNEGDDPLGNDEVPPTPEENPDVWQANTEQEPPGHYGNHKNPDGSTYAEGDSGLHYASHGSSGRRDWFYYRAPVEEVVEHHDAVTHEEYKYKRCEEAPVEVTPNVTFTPDDCDADESGLISVTPVEGVRYFLNAQGSQGDPIDITVGDTGLFPGNWIVTAVVDDGYVLADGAESEWLFTAIAETDCTEVVEVPAAPDTLDPCGLDNVEWASVPEDTETLDWTLNEDGSLTVEPQDGYVFDQDEQSVTFMLPEDSGEECPPGQPDPTSDSSQECVDGDLVITQSATHYVWSEGAGEWVPVGSSSQWVEEDAAKCAEKSNPPKEPKEPKEPAVPTSVDAGL